MTWVLSVGRAVAPWIARNFAALFTGWTANEVAQLAGGQNDYERDESRSVWIWSGAGVLIGAILVSIPLLFSMAKKRRGK